MRVDFSAMGCLMGFPMFRVKFDFEVELALVVFEAFLDRFGVAFSIHVAPTLIVRNRGAYFLMRFNFETLEATWAQLWIVLRTATVTCNHAEALQLQAHLLVFLLHALNVFIVNSHLTQTFVFIFQLDELHLEHVWRLITSSCLLNSE